MKLFWALLSTLFLTSFAAFSQVTEPVKWSFSQKEVAEGEYELRFVAKIEKGWYVYAQDIAEGGPVPTSFVFEENKDFTVDEDIKERGKKIDGFDKFFNMEVAKYKRSVRFYATVKSDKPAIYC